VTDHWFEPLGEHMGPAYLRYSFTKGTQQEVDFVVTALGLRPGMRVLDVGCGPGRHAYLLAERGFVVHGIDISQRFVDLACEHAPVGATFQRLDARDMAFAGEFDAAICLCQGAFGLMTAEGDDIGVLAGIANALKAGSMLALSAFNAYFVVKHFAESSFDADTGVNHERTEVRNESGVAIDADLWTGCYTPRELRLLCDAVGLDAQSISSVEPGAYGTNRPTVDSPEFLVIARRC
jgi:SAM-dependent methyltransferase